MNQQGEQPSREDASYVEDYPLYGVSLKQYAAIQAALTEGFALEQVLQKERVAAYDWSRAERKWQKRFGEQKVLAVRLAIELAAAEDWLWRDVQPLQDDATVWATFYAAHSAAPQRDKWLARWNLGKNDVSRLLRHWSRRAETDATLAQRLSQLPTNTELPPITASPKVLKRARKGGAAATMALQPSTAPVQEEKAPRTATPDELDVFVFGIDRYAGLCAELEVFPKEADRIRSKYNLATEADRQILAQRMREHLATHADHERDYRRQHQLALSRARKLAETTTADERAEAARKRSESEHVKPSFAELDQVLSPPVVLETPPAPPQVPTPPQGASGATQDVGSLFAAISEPALPFAPTDSKATPEEIVARIEETTVKATEKAAPDKPEANDASGTQDVNSILAKIALPTGWKAPAPTRPPEPAIEKPTDKPVTRPPEKSVSATKPPVAVATLPELSVDQYAYLCIELESRPDRTAEVLARYHVPAEALDTVHAVWRQRLAFDPGAKEAFGRISMDYKVWLAGQSRAAPRLTLEQYASLLVDLSRAPGQRAEILQRYGLDEATKTALDQSFQQRFQADPRLRTAFDQATSTYRAWRQRS